jgi:hypothetical protein
MSVSCFCPEEASYCKSLVDVWVYSPDENMSMPEPGCQRLVDAENYLSWCSHCIDELQPEPTLSEFVEDIPF